MYKEKDLPEPLRREEEQELAYAYQNFKDTEARNKLVIHNLRYALAKAGETAKRLGRKQHQQLEDIAIQTCLDAAEDFQPRGIKFISFLDQRLKWNFNSYISHYLKEKASYTTKLGQPYPINEKLPLDEQPTQEWNAYETPTYTYEDIVWDPETPNLDDTFLLEERKDIIQETLNTLGNNVGKRYETILREYFLEEKTLAEIGTQFGLDRERVRQLKEKGLHHLRKYCARRLSDFARDC